MGRKILKSVSVIQLVLSIIIYFSLDNAFSNNRLIAPMLETTEFTSTLLRLSIYVIPGITLITSLYGLVFSAIDILSLICGFNILSCVCLLLLSNGSNWLNTIGIINIVLEIIFAIGIIILSFEKRRIK